MKGIITLCGSVRFEYWFTQLNRSLTLSGWVVLAPGVFEHDWLHRPENNAELRKNALDELHCDKIKMSDAVVIINLGGYIGVSTSNEMKFAEEQKKNIFFLETSEFLPERRSWKELLNAQR
jgi:hypothetical protein